MTKNNKDIIYCQFQEYLKTMQKKELFVPLGVDNEYIKTI